MAEKELNIFRAKPSKREKRVGIYCRVSTNSAEQLKSLTAQASALTRLTAVNPKWLLVDVYIDIASSKTGSSRKEFTRMLKDCQAHDLDIIITKSISRFARNMVDFLETVRRLKGLGIEVIFHEENIRTSESSDDMLLSALSAIAQAQSESTSESVKWGLKRGFISGKSKLYARNCFGYKHNEKGELIIDEGQAEVVRTIFDLYMSGILPQGIH